MKRHIPGLHSLQQDGDRPLEGLFLVRVEWASYRWHPQKAFLQVRFVVLGPEPFERRSFSGRLYCTARALWKLNWFLRDFGYDMELLSQDQMDEKALINLRGVVRTTFKTVNALGELFNLLVRKAKRPPARARKAILSWRDAFPLIETSAEVMLAAADLATDHQLSIWDSVILSAAAESGCRLLLSEDLQEGFTWEGVTVTNPFASSKHELLTALLEAEQES